MTAITHWNGAVCWFLCLKYSWPPASIIQEAERGRKEKEEETDSMESDWCEGKGGNSLVLSTSSTEGMQKCETSEKLASLATG